ncbi:MAG: aspartate-semialdehyde dehydrogenase [Eubacteriales bacterium]|nr:aspartate-semialdehyde dehydrogenase [Eubacteriales bacterium]
MKQYKIAVVGATGMVGRMFLRVLEERKLPVSEYFLFASARSAGTTVDFMGKKYTVRELTEGAFKDLGVDIALFSAGAGTSKTFAPIVAASGAVVIDNSSCWRMDPKVPLVVPEVNPQAIPQYKKKGIIANPNCSTIQAMVPLKPLSDQYGLKRVIYSTYQAVSGAGMGGYTDLENGLKGEAPKKFPYPIAGNVLPQIDVFLENGYTKEEQKMVDETRKILGLPNLRVTATTVRVPVFHGHSESINVELEKPYELSDIRALWEHTEGLIVQDDTSKGLYPMPIYAADTDPVYVGRLRRDFSVENGINFWCVADNIRKGAATNAVQIAQELIRQWEA